MSVNLNRIIGACLDLGIPWDYLLWIYINEIMVGSGRPRTNTQDYIFTRFRLAGLIKAMDVLVAEGVVHTRTTRLFSLLFRVGCQYTKHETPPAVRRDVMAFLRKQDRFDMVVHPDYLWLKEAA